MTPQSLNHLLKNNIQSALNAGIPTEYIVGVLEMHKQALIGNYFLSQATKIVPSTTVPPNPPN